MDFVLAQDLTIGFHPCCVAVAMMSCRGDSVIVPGILIGPSFAQPLPRICFVRSNQVEAFGVNARWVAERLYVACHQEVEWFDLIDVFLSFVELRKGPHDGWTSN